MLADCGGGSGWAGGCCCSCFEAVVVGGEAVVVACHMVKMAAVCQSAGCSALREYF